MATATKPADPASRSWLRRNLTFILALPFVVVLVVKGFDATGLNLSESFSTILTQFSLSEEWTTGSISLFGWSVRIWVAAIAGIILLAILVGALFVSWFRNLVISVIVITLALFGLMYARDQINNHVQGPYRGSEITLVRDTDPNKREWATSRKTTFSSANETLVRMPLQRDGEGVLIQAVILSPQDFCPLRERLGVSPNRQNHLSFSLTYNRPADWRRLTLSPALQAAIQSLEQGGRQVEITYFVWRSDSRSLPFTEPRCS